MKTSNILLSPAFLSLVLLSLCQQGCIEVQRTAFSSGVYSEKDLRWSRISEPTYTQKEWSCVITTVTVSDIKSVGHSIAE